MRARIGLRGFWPPEKASELIPKTLGIVGHGVEIREAGSRFEIAGLQRLRPDNLAYDTCSTQRLSNEVKPTVLRDVKSQVVAT